jgi:tripartite-type tricarboxylate transporter receptor subunit TctC
MNNTLSRLLGATLALLIAAPWGGAQAQEYPSRPIRLVLGFPSGGTPDALARRVAAQIEVQLGRNIVVDNRTGANGIIAAGIVASAPPDGYTMLFGPPALLINQIVQKKAPYDLLRDFAPVANICRRMAESSATARPASGTRSTSRASSSTCARRRGCCTCRTRDSRRRSRRCWQGK